MPFGPRAEMSKGSGADHAHAFWKCAESMLFVQTPQLVGRVRAGILAMVGSSRQACRAGLISTRSREGWLKEGEGEFLVALSQRKIASALTDHGTQLSPPFAESALGARGVEDCVEGLSDLRSAICDQRSAMSATL